MSDPNCERLPNRRTIDITPEVTRDECLTEAALLGYDLLTHANMDRGTATHFVPGFVDWTPCDRDRLKLLQEIASGASAAINRKLRMHELADEIAGGELTARAAFCRVRNYIPTIRAGWEDENVEEFIEFLHQRGLGEFADKLEAHADEELSLELEVERASANV